MSSMPVVSMEMGIGLIPTIADYGSPVMMCNPLKIHPNCAGKKDLSYTWVIF